MKHNLKELKKLRELIITRNIAWQIQIAGTNGCRFNPDYFINEQEFYEVGEFIIETRKKYPLDKLAIAGSHDVGYFSKYFSDYGAHRHKYWRGCGAGIFTNGIMSDGSVKGCLALNDRFIEANIRERSIEDIWRDPGLFIRNRDFDVNRLHGFCAVCQYSEICRAGCQDMCFSSTGSVYSNKYCFHRLEEEYALSPNKNITE